MFVDMVGFTRLGEHLSPTEQLALLRAFHAGSTLARGRQSVPPRVSRPPSGQQAPAVSIDLHYGPVVAGDIGGVAQRQFTVSGDTVNVASRLEALIRSLGAVILASDRSWIAPALPARPTHWLASSSFHHSRFGAGRAGSAFGHGRPGKAWPAPPGKRDRGHTGLRLKCDYFAEVEPARARY